MNLFRRNAGRNGSAEEAIRILERAIDAAGSGIIISEITSDGPRHVFVNEAVETITGYAGDELLGETFELFQTHSDEQHLIDEMLAAIEAGRPYEVIRRDYRKDGTQFWNELSLAPVHDGTGDLTHYVSVLNDVTTLMETQESLQRTEKFLVDAQRVAKVGSWEWDLRSGQYRRSAELWRLLGLEPESASNSLEDFLAVIHPADRATVQRTVLSAVEARQPYDIVFRIIGHDEGEKYMRSRCDVEYDDAGEPIRLYGTGMDITEAKLSEQQLQKALRELERSNKELEHFAYIASHDLQEPLRKIQMFGDRLQTKLIEALPPEAAESIERMCDGATRMRLLIDDLLSFSRVTSSSMEFEPVDLAKIVRDTIDGLEVPIAEAGAKISIGDMPRLEAVPGQMTHLFQNLVSNAIKFRRVGVRPRIAIQGHMIEATDVDGTANVAHCEITVSDNGIGFEPEHGTKIFDLFQRLHSRTEYAGTGLGLAICRRIVERHGGTIRAEGIPGKGATFRIRLPHSQADPAAMERAA